MVCKNFLWKVVDELSVDEAVDLVVDDLHTLFPHLLLLCCLYLSHLHVCVFICACMCVCVRAETYVCVRVYVYACVLCTYTPQLSFPWHSIDCCTAFLNQAPLPCTLF